MSMSVLIPFVSCSLPLKDVCSPRKVEIIKSALNEVCMHLEDVFSANNLLNYSPPLLTDGMLGSIQGAECVQ